MKKVFATFAAALIGLFAGLAAESEPQVMLNWSPTFEEQIDFNMISIRNASQVGQKGVGVFDNTVFSKDHPEDPLEVSKSVFDVQDQNSYFFFEFYSGNQITGFTDYYTYAAFMSAVSEWGSSYQPSASPDYLDVTVHGSNLAPEPTSGLLLLLGGALLGLKRKRREENKRRTARSSRRTSWRRAKQVAVLCGLLLAVPSSVWAGAGNDPVSETVSKNSAYTYTDWGGSYDVTAQKFTVAANDWKVGASPNPAVAKFTITGSSSTDQPQVKIEATGFGETTGTVTATAKSKNGKTNYTFIWTIKVTVKDIGQNRTSSLTYEVGGDPAALEAPGEVASHACSGWKVNSNTSPGVAVVSVVFGATEATQRPKVTIETKSAGTTTCVIGSPSSDKIWTLNITVTEKSEPSEPETPENPQVEIKYDNYRKTVASGNPQSIMLSYYDGPDTRGFAWQTDLTVKQGGVSVLAGDYSQDHAAFSNAVAVVATTSSHTECVCYKASVSGLTEGVHTYRLGTTGHYAYGTFTVKLQSQPLTILNVNDVQTKEPTKLYMWQNCVAAMDRLLGGGTKADFIISGGDFFDQNGPSGTDNYVRWGVIADNARPAFADVPWIMASGNHDTGYYNTGVMEHYSYTSSSAPGCHAFTSGPLHVATVPFVEDPVSKTWPTAVEEWVKTDLAQAQDATWRVLVMHSGPYTTGDHGYVASSTYIQQVSKICAAYKVDLVLQAHDHTYSRTLPYRWSGQGYTTSENDSTVVNLSPATLEINGNTYYQKPEGTFYVSAGCAGHRVGEQDAYANRSGTSSYTKRTYKIVTDTVKVASEYAKVGDDGAKDVGKSMFAVLRVDGELLDYEWYVAGDNGTPVLFDVLRVSKYDPASDPLPAITEADGDGRVTEVLAASPASLKGYVKDVATYTAFRNWVKGNGIDPQTAKTSAASYFSFVADQTGLVDLDQVLNGGVVILNVESAGSARVRLTVGVRNCTIGEKARSDALATMFGVVGSTTQAGTFSAERVRVADDPNFQRNDDGTVSYTVELTAPAGEALPGLFYLKAQLTLD